MTAVAFPKGFIWGTATASYQIEGGFDADGRGLSIWDTFCRTPGKVFGGDAGDVSCDHYHRWPDDIKLMQRLGVNAYRFSVAWPRIVPQGTGEINLPGLDFYDRLVDGLLAARITPFVTLYHWDLPQGLQDKGGWTNRNTVDAFIYYTDLVARRLGDRVKNWITFNEPWVSAFLGYYTGVHAPGVQDLKSAVLAAHHLLLAHGRTVPLLRVTSKDSKVGITLNLSPARPATPQDAEAARRHDGYLNRWFLDPVFGRGYPKDMLDVFGSFLPSQADADVKEMGAAIDFLGVNYYFPAYVRAMSTTENPLGFDDLSPDELRAKGFEVTEMGWPVVPDGLFELLTRVHKDYAPKVMYITENGCAFADKLDGGKVDDPRRAAYLDGHLRAAQQAVAAGVPLRGYFLWSLMDNFEWAHGYSKRFGIVYTDYATLARIPKASYHWYKGVIAANALG